MSRYQSIIFFDLDNTLIEGPFGTAVFPVVLDEIARKTKCDVKEIRQMIVKENWERQHDPNCSAVQAMDWDDIFLTVARRLGAETLEADAAEIVRARAKEHSTLHDGAHEILAQLRAPHRALMLATKGLIKYQRPVLEKLDLVQFFDDILTPDSNNALKKDRRFYGKWLDDSSNDLLVPTRIMVGDYYVDDILPAHEFGLKTIWKNDSINDELKAHDPFVRPHHYNYKDDQPVKPEAIIHSLYELPNVVTQLETAVMVNR